jgi:hypothetical protein
LERLAYMEAPGTAELVQLAMDLAAAEERDDGLDAAELERVANELRRGLEVALRDVGAMSRWSQPKLEEWLKARLGQVRELQDLLGAEADQEPKEP